MNKCKNCESETCFDVEGCPWCSEWYINGELSFCPKCKDEYFLREKISQELEKAMKIVKKYSPTKIVIDSGVEITSDGAIVYRANVKGIVND